MAKEKKEQEPSFEDALRKLNEIVKKLESQDVPLEGSLDLFEEGIKLSKLCRDRLKTVELKLEELKLLDED